MSTSRASFTWIFNDPAIASVSALVKPVIVFCNPSVACPTWPVVCPTAFPAVFDTEPTAFVGADPGPDSAELSSGAAPFLRPPFAVSSPDFSGSSSL